MYILIENYEKDIMFVTDTGRSEWSGLQGVYTTQIEEFSNKKKLIEHIKEQKKSKTKYSYKIYKGNDITKIINKENFKRKKDPVGLYKFFNVN